MTEREPSTSPKPPDRSRRAAILATVGIVVIMGLALFVGTVVLPLWQTHVVMRDLAKCEAFPALAVARLGGPDRAADRFAAYLCLPGWMKPNRFHATFLLGYCGPRAVPALVKALEDRDADVRYNAASALGRIGPEAKAAVPALVKALGHTDAEPRSTAAWALGEIGPKAKAAVPTLENLRRDPELKVRTAAAVALARIRGEKPPDVVEEAP